MSQILYLTREAVGKYEQTTASPDPPSDLGDLTIGGIDTFYSNYIQYFSDLNYAQHGGIYTWINFQIGSASFIKPPDYDSHPQVTYTYSADYTQQLEFYHYTTVVVPDDFVIPTQFDHGLLADGWTGDSTSATSGDFSWSSPTTAVYNNSGTTLSLPDVTAVAKYGFGYAANYVIGDAAKSFGVKPLFDAIKRAGTLDTALTNFVNGGTDTLTQLLNGFNTGMTAEQADALLQSFMNTTAFNFHQAAEKILGTGTGDSLKVIMESLRLTEKWAIDPATGQLKHSDVGAEDGTHTGYFGQYAQFSGDPSYRNDVVLSGDSSDYIDTGSDTGFTPRAQIDFIAAGGGADVIQSYEGADVIAAGFGNDRIIAGAGNDYIDGGGGCDTAFYTGVMSNYTITHNANGSFTVTDNRPGSPDGTDTLIGVEQLMFTNGAANPLYVPNQSLTIAPAPAIRQDFNEDGRSDLLWRSTAGEVVTWDAVSVNGHTGVDLGKVGLQWQVSDTGDFDRDGKSDLLWRSNTGEVVTWMSDASGASYGGVSFGTVGLNWKILGTADFNGDGVSDILWRAADGSVAIWSDVAKGISGGQSFGSVGSNWHIVGAGDFTGDGKSALLWRSDSGDVVTWENLANGSYVGKSIGVVNPSWHVVGTGDINGDAKEDIIWRSNSGDVVTWENIAGTSHSAESLGHVEFNWQVARTGDDFNSDGKGDILWRDTGNGQIVAWENITNNSHGGESLGAVDLSWIIQQHHYEII
ncbi:hypothetical protein BSN85_35035 [Bradyrhizobium brasilense]|uniref:FG-GAP-like repeat-containing protein n=1 Tax=Bradyrhizobium brasilense TaxID=1419277 RepID=UPI0009774E45|nr:FG-GAP-like repeat-containing protein [Bradyrhizobium brasilense]OMI00029.1 hypothetical protein BSN85_35035 [Bradyrhizobium brasilense]